VRIGSHSFFLPWCSGAAPCCRGRPDRGSQCAALDSSDAWSDASGRACLRSGGPGQVRSDDLHHASPRTCPTRAAGAQCPRCPGADFPLRRTVSIGFMQVIARVAPWRGDSRFLNDVGAECGGNRAFAGGAHAELPAPGPHRRLGVAAGAVRGVPGARGVGHMLTTRSCNARKMSRSAGMGRAGHGCDVCSWDGSVLGRAHTVGSGARWGRTALLACGCVTGIFALLRRGVDGMC